MFKRRLILIVVIFSMSCNSPVNNTESVITEPIDKPDQMSWNVNISITHSGKIRANIRADYLEQYSEKTAISLENNVQIDFYNDEEKLISSLFADKTNINERISFLQAIDNVIVQSDSGVTLFTDTLTWDNEKEIIFTEDSVMITTASSDTLYGVGFQSDVDMEHWRILKPRGVTSR